MAASGDTSVIAIPIRPGMREDVHRHAAAEPGTLRYAQNVRWGDLGAAARRNGTTEIATTGATGNQATIAGGYPVELLAPDAGGGTIVGSDGTAFALRDDETGWRYAGRYSSAEPRPGRVDLYRNQASQVSTDQQVTLAIDSAGRRFFAYTANYAGSSQRMYYTFQDADGNTIESRMYTDVRRVRACAVAADIYVCCQRYASHEVDVYRLQAGGTLTLLTSALVTLDAAADSWDMSSWTSTLWLFAALDSSTATITIRAMSAGTTSGSRSHTANVLATSRLTIYGSSTHAWLGYNNIGTTDIGYIRAFDSSLNPSFAAATAYSWTVTTQHGSAPWVGPGPSATQVRFVGAIHNQGGHAVPDVYSLAFGTIDTSGTVATTGGQYYVIPASKPFGPSGQYLWADMIVRRTPSDVFEAPMVRCLLRCRQNANAASEPPYYVVDLLGHEQPESRAATAPGLFTGAGYDWAWTPAQTLSGTYFAPMLIDVVGGSAAAATGVSRYPSFREFAISSTTAGVLARRDIATVDTSLVVAGQPCVIQRPVTVHDSALGTSELNQDGFELGIHRPPVILALSSSNSSGLLTNAGVYQYVACYRVTDAYGREQRSAPSSPRTITLGASDDTVAFTLATIEVQRNLLTTTEAVIELYRTEAGGSTFFLLDDTFGNDVTVQGVASTDGLDDSTLNQRRILYTQVSNVANDMAPACRFLRASETRLWAAGGWDSTIVQASQLLVPGEVPNWSDLGQFKIRLPKPCVGGLAFQDGSLLAFAATDIYDIKTDGGPDNGGAGTFADPRLISPGIGCEEPASIVETPQGVFFRSRRGFEILPRGGGAPTSLPGVETTLETYTTVVSACLHVDETAMTVQVVVRAASTATRTLVYDLDRGAWSVDVYPIDLAQVGVTADGRLIMASDDAATSPAFLVESSSAKDDDAVFYQARLTFHDIYPVGVFKACNVNRVLLRGDAQGTCILNADVGVDGGTAKTATSTFSGATTFEAYRETTPPNAGSHGTSVQLAVYDTTSGDAASGFNLYGLGVEVLDRGQTVRTASAERMA